MNVLVVEDEELSFIGLSSLLIRNQIAEIDRAKNWEEFDSKNLKKYDFAFVDLFLGKNLNGIQVAKKLEFHDVRFCLMTSSRLSPDTYNVLRGLKMIKYLKKPLVDNDVKMVLELVR